MFDGVATLIGYGSQTFDEYGNEIVETTEREVFVQPRGVFNSEFYNAAQAGLKPSLTLFLSNREDYHGETVLTYEGRNYEVIRTDWNAQRDGISLICQENIENE